MSTTAVSTSPLLAGLVDDAGLFPPTALEMPAAVARHRADQRGGAGMLTHRFLCPASRLGEVRAELADTDRIQLGLITDQGVNDLGEALETVVEDHRLSLALVEIPLAKFRDDTDPVGVATAVSALERVSTDVAAFLEPATPDEIDEVLTQLRFRNDSRVIGAKLRCGGVRAELFPSPATVAHVIATCARSGVPFKATAGLHQAVRHRDPQTGFWHHGYLNLLLAAAAASIRSAEDELTGVLSIEERAALGRRIQALGTDDAARARRLLVSYGSCSTSTPISQAEEILAGHKGDDEQ